jgi:hypothetical protein
MESESEFIVPLPTEYVSEDYILQDGIKHRETADGAISRHIPQQTPATGDVSEERRMLQV